MGAEKKQRTEERNPGEPRAEVREQSAGRVGGGPAQGGRETWVPESTPTGGVFLFP